MCVQDEVGNSAVLGCFFAVLFSFMLCYRTYGSFTMETIIATAFGRLVDLQKGQSDELTEAAARLFALIRERKTFNAQFLTVILSKNMGYIPRQLE